MWPTGPECQVPQRADAWMPSRVPCVQVPGATLSDLQLLRCSYLWFWDRVWPPSTLFSCSCLDQAANHIHSRFVIGWETVQPRFDFFFFDVTKIRIHKVLRQHILCSESIYFQIHVLWADRVTYSSFSAQLPLMVLLSYFFSWTPGWVWEREARLVGDSWSKTMSVNKINCIIKVFAAERNGVS